MISIVLASKSPRRKMLLEAAGIGVEIEPSHVDETPKDGESAMMMVERLAKAKAAVIDSNEIIVAADSAVVLSGTILGKPLDDNDARKILARLSSEEHQVMTGYCVRRGAEERTGVVTTQVWFRQLSDGDIARYIATGEPNDKAGAYGIQGVGGTLVDRISGSYTNVVGLPLREVLWEIEDLSR